MPCLRLWGAVLLTIGRLSFFYVIVIFDEIGELLRFEKWLPGMMGANPAGKVILSFCFLVFMLAHFTEGAI